MSQFKPHFGLSSPHLQTIIGAFRRGGKPAPSETRHVPLADGDHIACEWSIPSNFNKIVILVHGLGGSSRSRYMVRLSRKLYKRGFMAVRMNLRGSYGPARLPYHGGRSDDLLAVIQSLKKEFIDKEICVVGFSLGANIALKLAGELGQTNLITKTIAICPPLDLAICAQKIEKSLYHRYYLRALCKQAKKWIREPIRTLYEFDDKVTAPLGGFCSAADYYAKVSSKNFLNTIGHPCTLLMAQDDPFIPKEVIHLAVGQPVELVVTRHGGHMGYVGSRFYWLDEQILSWL